MLYWGLWAAKQTDDVSSKTDCHAEIGDFSEVEQSCLAFQTSGSSLHHGSLQVCSKGLADVCYLNYEFDWCRTRMPQRCQQSNGRPFLEYTQAWPPNRQSSIRPNTKHFQTSNQSLWLMWSHVQWADILKGSHSESSTFASCLSFADAELYLLGGRHAHVSRPSFRFRH